MSNAQKVAGKLSAICRFQRAVTADANQQVLEKQGGIRVCIKMSLLTLQFLLTNFL